MKVNRHAKIIELITKYQVETQEELAAYLTQEGFKVTQATVSRDIRDLRLTKIPTEDGKQRYSIHPKASSTMNDKYTRVLKDGFSSMDMAQSILVIRTVSGMAMAVATAIDSLEFPEVLGTIAGDDTIMCAVRTGEDTKEVMDKINKIVM